MKGGIYKAPLGRQYQRVQIYTIDDYFKGLTPDMPDIADAIKAPRQKRQSKGKQTTFWHDNRSKKFGLK